MKRILRIILSDKKQNRLFAIVAAVMAMLRAGSLYFYKDQQVPMNTAFILLIILLRIMIYTALFFAIFFLINRVMNKTDVYAYLLERDKINDKKSYAKDYVFLAVSWLPFLVIKYPGAFCPDTWSMLYGYRNGSFSEHHSVYYTYMAGKLVDIGNAVGHPNWGLFMFALFHYILFIIAFGYSLNLLRKMHISKPIRCVVSMSYLINPYILGYIGVLLKDIAFTACMMIFVLCIVDICIDEIDFARHKWKLLLLAFAIINVYLIRKNGSYIVIATALLFAIWSFRKKRKKMPVAVMILACFVSMLFFGWLGDHFNATKGSIREALSLPFQQTARYVKYYGSEVSEEEKKAIDAVLDYGLLAEKYNPRISDPVRGTYREDRSKLAGYFRAWIKGFLKHPLCYVQATWEQNYYLFIPENDNIVFYQDTDIGYEIGNTIYMPDWYCYEDIFGKIYCLQTIQEWVVQEFYLFHELPIIRLLGNVSFWMYLLMFISVIFYANRLKIGIVFVPMCLTIIFVLLGPAIQGHPRYMFPVIYALPFLLLFVFWCNVNKSIK